MEQYQIEAVDIGTFNQNAKANVEKIISESPDMITALECVGAMYGIPPSHIMAQPGITSIKVTNDFIQAPPDVRPNTKAIVCSIGGVLDHISQRMNDKLDQQHDIETKEGRDHEHVSQNASPSKGKVIARHVDANGDELLVYDSGLIDMANTKEAHLKADELKQTMKIPMYNPDAMRARDMAYFSDDDKIELTTNANIDEDTMNDNDPKPTDIANNINESAFHVELLSHYHDTDHLGYELLQEQGFDYVRPTEAFVLEADEEKNRTKVNPEDIKHMKFDNTNLTKAIQAFNRARAEQSEKGKGEFDLTAFTSSEGYKQGISYLEKQFDCHLSVHFAKNPEHNYANSLYTTIYLTQYNDKVQVSKSKGFQLNGLPVTVVCMNNAIDEEMKKDTEKELFGQFMCAGLCHEIFHNIANAIRTRTNAFIFTTASAMTLAMSTDDAKARREIFERLADTITVEGHHLNHFEKKKLVKRLCYTSAIADNQEELSKIQNALSGSKSLSQADQEVEQLIKRYEAIVASYSPKLNKAVKRGEKYQKHPHRYKALNGIATALCCTAVGAFIGLPMLKLLPDKSDAAILKTYTDYLNKPNKEEYYCDLFAGMYNLPLTFTYGFKNRHFAANDLSEENLSYLTGLEKDVNLLMLSKYPSQNERNYAAYKIAKTILSGKEKLSKEYREYCEWVVNNYSKIEKTGIHSDTKSSTFDAKEAEDLDQHVQNLIMNNGIPVTESYHERW